MTDLERYLRRTKFSNLDDIDTAFSLCESFDDVLTVIDEIPHKFGTFIAELMDEKGKYHDPDDYDGDEQDIIGFVITNSYVEHGDYQEDVFEYEWYED